MILLNIKEKDLSIIVPFKSGHTLLYTTFIHLFKHLNIDVEIENNPNKFLNNVYIFVRNPIDRFISSYFYLNRMLNDGQDEYKNGIVNLIKNTNINDIDGYISRYEIFIKECDDFHYIPQSSQILYNNCRIYKEEIIDAQTDLKLLYDLRFGSNYKIFKIEDIDRVINKNSAILIHKNIGFDNKLDSMAFNIDKFYFLNDYSKEVNFLFTTFYLFFKNINKINGHHKNVDYLNEVTFSGYSIIQSLTENERVFFKYPKKSVDINIFKKNLI